MDAHKWAPGRVSQIGAKFFPPALSYLVPTPPSRVHLTYISFTLCFHMEFAAGIHILCMLLPCDPFEHDCTPGVVWLI